MEKNALLNLYDGISMTNKLNAKFEVKIHSKIFNPKILNFVSNSSFSWYFAKPNIQKNPKHKPPFWPYFKSARWLEEELYQNALVESMSE